MIFIFIFRVSADYSVPKAQLGFIHFLPPLTLFRVAGGLKPVSAVIG